MTRYLTADHWGHIFDDRHGEEEVRFVYDRISCSVIAMEDRKSGNFAYAPSSPERVADFSESLGNYDMTEKGFSTGSLGDPEDFGMTETDELPDWAASRVAATIVGPGI